MASLFLSIPFELREQMYSHLLSDIPVFLSYRSPEQRRPSNEKLFPALNTRDDHEKYLMLPMEKGYYSPYRSLY